MDAALLEVDIFGRSTTPFTIRFTKAVVDSRVHKIIGTFRPDTPGKLGGATFEMVSCEISRPVHDPRAEPDISFERLVTFGFERLGACAKPAILQVAQAIQRAGGPDAVFAASLCGPWAVRAADQISVKRERMEAMVAWFVECEELADMVARGIAVPVFLDGRSDTIIRSLTVSSGEPGFSRPVAKLVCDGLQVGWINTEGQPVPVRDPSRTR